MRLAVTTPLEAGWRDEEAARDAAARREVAFVARAGRAFAQVAAASRADALLVVGRHRAALWIDGAEHAWSGGMGELRLKRLHGGERTTRDPFLEAAALRAGDAVLDATLGLGMDALVAAGAVGSGGRVLGIERSTALAALVGEGLSRHRSDAARRVEVRAGDAAEVLARLADRSFDVVCFDPMFRSPRAGAPGFDLVRRLADPRPLAPETLAQARRVARRWVVVKDGTPGWDLARLGLSPLPCARWAEKLYARVAAH
jgi:16S rRNA (guanine1516-N2)-methyltransferase